MPDPEINPEGEGTDPEGTDSEGQDPEGQDPEGGDPEGQEPKPEGDYMQEPPVRKSEVESYKTKAEEDKRMKRIEYNMRKMKEENQKLKEQLGGDYPKTVEPTYSDLPQEDETDYKLFEEMDKKERAMEMSSFLKENPEYQEVKGSLEKFIDHPVYKNVPVDFIAKAISADKAQKMGAAKVLQSQKKAKMSQVGGHPVKQTTSEKDWLNASKEDFEAEMAKVKKGHYKK